MSYRRFLVMFVCGLALSMSIAGASVSETEVEFSRDLLYRSAKRYIMRGAKLRNAGEVKDLIQLADLTSGLLRFEYRDGVRTIQGALIEAIELDSAHAKLRVTLPFEQEGRTLLLKEKIIAEATEWAKPGAGRELSYAANRVYDSIRRYLLKKFVTSGKGVDDVLTVDAKDIGYLQFSFRDGKFHDPMAVVEIEPQGDSSSRLRVILSLDMLRQISLEDEIVRTVQSDLGPVREDPTDTEP